MARFDPLHETFDLASLKDAVVVITGGAEGIGRAAVELFALRSAKVVFGDYNLEKGKELESKTEGVDFVSMDARIYEDNLRLFNFAMTKYGRVDHAIANAGVIKRPGWFTRHENLESLQSPPDTMTHDVNLKGVLYFAHIACSYLSHGESRDKTLTLLSSHGGFQETPGMPFYSTAKHAIIGLMRALRVKAVNDYPHLRVNAICPSFTVTRMFEGIDKCGRKLAYRNKDPRQWLQS
jgi:NAD(P)-dependent dehydrogenase (short-subunit alcohol dehydrogenase family)